MGEAKTRRDALERRQPLPQDLTRCPVCLGHRTVIAEAPADLAMSHVATPHGVCADCKAIWEAYPADWKHDVVEGSPCDNCAFSAGSPESQDREGWKSLLAKLRHGQTFNCHKGAPIIQNKSTGAVEFDEAWVQRHGRTCAGFLKAMQQWPDWLDHRFSVLHVTTTHDQDRLLGVEPVTGEP